MKNYKVDRVIRSKENVKVTIGSEHLNYDQIVLATHADQSLAMLDEPSDDENRILGKFRYVSNNAVLHTDQRFMPNNKATWSSWNSISSDNKTCVTYWLNKLQNLKCNNNIEFVRCDLINKIENFDIIVSNPPYLSEFDYKKTSQEIISQDLFL